MAFALVPPMFLDLLDEQAVAADGGWSDARLVRAVAAVLAVPRRDPADSFVLHAPLELAARAALLPFVPPSSRAVARRRLVALARGYDASGPGVEEPVPLDPGAGAVDPGRAAARLVDAIDRGELDDVDAAAARLGATLRPAEMQRALADAVLPRLAAAAHAPIFLYHLPRVAPRGELDGRLLRGLARELARHPDWRLSWIDGDGGGGGDVGREGSASTAVADPGIGPDALADALATTPLLGVPGSTFIQPLMAQVDARVAPELLAGVTRADAVRLGPVVLRTAARSMLEEPPEHAPYGWSHCLTMSQAALGIASASTDPSRALAVAATYVVGFRAAIASGPLDRSYAPDPPGIGWRDALDAGPAVAAAAVHHAADREPAEVREELATRASVGHDAHLVKYVLACLDAAAADPVHARLFLAAGASLVAWWAEAGNDAWPG